MNIYHCLQSYFSRSAFHPRRDRKIYGFFPVSEREHRRIMCAANYDFLGQLISADSENQTDESYVYDANGNRLTANGDTYTTGTNNELTSDGNYTYTYDAEGNRISKTNPSGTERELYTWDYRNRLTQVTQQIFKAESQTWETVQIVEYAYNYNNVWIRKVIGTDKTIFIPENYQTTVQIDNGTTTHHYLWTPN